MKCGYKYIILLVLTTIIFSSCKDEEDVAIPDVPDKVKHTTLFGLKGNPVEMAEDYYDDLTDPSSAYNSTSMTFDKNGRLTSYVTTDGSYHYHYNSDDKLSEVIADYGDGKGEVKYQFHYNGHGVYAPCPVYFGGLNFYLIESLSEVVATGGNDYTFNYSCNTDKMHSIEIFDGIISEEQVTFANGFPAKRKRTVRIEGAEEGEYIEDYNYVYSYNADGILQYIDQSANAYGEVTSTKTTYVNGVIQQEDFYTEMDDMTLSLVYSDLYTYDPQGNLTKKVRKDAETQEEMDMEKCSYLKYDEQSNWTVKYGQLKMPWGLSMSTYYVKRNIKY